MRKRTGSCLCGQVSYDLRGAPARIGLCHCADCRKESGTMFVTFARWPREAFSMSGEYATHEGRSFCPRCGSRLFCMQDDEVEVRVGSLDAPTDLVPEYEIWVKRREPWLAPLHAAPQYDEDRFPPRGTADFRRILPEENKRRTSWTTRTPRRTPFPTWRRNRTNGSAATSR